MSREPDALPEPDRLEGAPHPREQTALSGHSDAEAAFLEGLRTGRLHHAWLIGGPAGIGKATLAYRAARFVLAHGGSVPDAARTLHVEPNHPAARQLAANAYPDVAVVRRGLRKDGKGYSAEIGVDHARRALELFASTAGKGGYRICIVDAADDLNASSANALLKVVEEPPPRSVFLIVSHAPQRLLPTIRSRCRRLLLRPLSRNDVRAVIDTLGPDFAAPPEVLDQAIDLGEGSVRRTVEMLDQGKIALVAEIAGALDVLPRVDAKRILALAETLQRREVTEAYELALDTVQRWLSRRLREGAGEGAARLAPLVEVCDKVARQAREIDAYNLDRRPLVLSLFDDLADAVRRTA